MARPTVQLAQAQETLSGERSHLEPLGQVERAAVRGLHHRDVRLLGPGVDIGEQTPDVRLRATLLSLLGDAEPPPGVLQGRVSPAGDEVPLPQPREP